MYAHPPRPSVAVGVSSPPLQFEHRPVMAKRTKSKPQERGSVLFDVLYEDESRASNRRVPMEILGGLDGDAPAREIIEEQDRAIAEKSGRPLKPIRSLTRSPIRVPSAVTGD